jgi:hypothetical protein
VTLPTADVSDLLRDRMAEPRGLQQMTVVSLLVHGALLAGMIFTPSAWMAGQEAEPPTVMTISLGGGTPGPENGGMTNISGQAVQAEPLPEPPARPEPVRRQLPLQRWSSPSRQLAPKPSQSLSRR